MSKKIFDEMIILMAMSGIVITGFAITIATLVIALIKFTC